MFFSGFEIMRFSLYVEHKSWFFERCKKRVLEIMRFSLYVEQQLKSFMISRGALNRKYRFPVETCGKNRRDEFANTDTQMARSKPWEGKGRNKSLPVLED